MPGSADPPSARVLQKAGAPSLESAMERLLQQVREEIPGVTGVAVGTFDGATWASRSWGSLDVASARAPLAALVRSWHETYEAVGGAVDFGSHDEILVSASKGYLLVRASHDRARFVAVFLEASGNIGYLRFRMREYLRVAAAA